MQSRLIHRLVIPVEYIIVYVIYLSITIDK